MYVQARERGGGGSRLDYYMGVIRRSLNLRAEMKWQRQSGGGGRVRARSRERARGGRGYRYRGGISLMRKLSNLITLKEQSLIIT